MKGQGKDRYRRCLVCRRKVARCYSFQQGTLLMCQNPGCLRRNIWVWRCAKCGTDHFGSGLPLVCDTCGVGFWLFDYPPDPEMLAAAWKEEETAPGERP